MCWEVRTRLKAYPVVRAGCHWTYWPVVMAEVPRRLQEVSPTTAAIALEVPRGRAFSPLFSFLHRWLPHSQSPVAASKSFVRFQTLFSEGREAHPGEWCGKGRTSPTRFPETRGPSVARPPIPNTGKYWPQTFWALQCLSLYSVHIPFLAVVENKFHSKVSNHFIRMRDLGGPGSLFYLIIIFKRTHDLLSQKTHGCMKESRDD